MALNDYQHVLGSVGALFGLFYYILIACFTEIMALIHTGDYVEGIIRKNIDKTIGHTCIIADKENNYYIRVLENEERPEHYNLLSLNEKSVVAKKKIMNIQIKLAAPIVCIRKTEPKN